MRRSANNPTTFPSTLVIICCCYLSLIATVTGNKIVHLQKSVTNSDQEKSVKVVNGEDILLSSQEAPWLVTLYIGTSPGHVCGGTIIRDNAILTAAHCITQNDDIRVYLNRYDFPLSSTSTPDYQLSHTSAITHEEYNPTTVDNDIALIFLNNDNTFTTNNYLTTNFGVNKWLASVPIEDPSTRPNSQYRVYGYGLLSDGGSFPTVLQAATLNYINSAICRINVPLNPVNMFCSGFLSGEKDSCSGDSGGPLVGVDLDNSDTIYGIVSWGLGCALPGAPGVYANVFHFKKWIEGKIEAQTNSNDQTSQTTVDSNSSNINTESSTARSYLSLKSILLLTLILGT